MEANLAELTRQLEEAEARLIAAADKVDKADGREIDRLTAEASAAEMQVRALQRQVSQAMAAERTRAAELRRRFGIQ